MEPVGQSGRHYLIERIIQERGLSHRVYLASAGNQKFILKEVLQSNLEYFQDIHHRLQSCQYLRVSQDTIPEPSMFVYEYFTDDLLSLAQKDLPLTVTKRILKDTLRGLAAMHDQNIVHTDVKPNNILVEYEHKDSEVVIKRVQLGDIEDAAYVPPECDIVGKQVGNWMWRSPEAHTQGRVNKPSDIFSFGIVCIYAVLKRVIFAIDDSELGEDEPLAVLLERQISYFADTDGLDGFLEYLGDSPWREVIEVLRDGFAILQSDDCGSIEKSQPLTPRLVLEISSSAADAKSQLNALYWRDLGHP
ncbi:hypothetical protein T310_4199 [Rasamsonia emersonii CBS 393.64]|uniref:non-specific serine/threonine protein kinase n=1 Tax=Rasamsonia emersonii (strain ATCC 16479 / CBS 393.64 / IMI 116815) TaxID=1408163 RepID=A0A0F4YU66_RASE3|nr:hypothetical protein T310_4199 [Rasamsonia emersonii CBS 393.64]KKA21774.1 hypothetical protein T310_4199 [Rasamsonia emersonii CBS 393.64]